MRFRLGCVAAVLVAATGAYGQLSIPGADGSDGALILNRDSGTRTIDLSQAASGPAVRWDTPSPAAGKGVYDPEKWAVVFKYSSVHLYYNSYINFANHPSNAPVVWLVSGDVVLDAGTSINLNGTDPQGATFALGGPGGFRGGRGNSGNSRGSGGMGPGGGNTNSNGNNGAGSYGTTGPVSNAVLPVAPTYGNWMVLPLIGGSGGGNSEAGSGGGGAILIAATGKITINGYIAADGGWAYGSGYRAGSGGAIRLVADVVNGAGALYARGDSGSGKGRISVQANDFLLQQVGDPFIAVQCPIVEPLMIWLPSTAPTIKPVSIVANGQTIPVPDDPRASFFTNLADAQFETSDSVTLNIAAQNVPLNWTVVVRVVPREGPPFSVTADPLQGTQESSTTTAPLSLARGVGAIQVRAYKPVQ